MIEAARGFTAEVRFTVSGLVRHGDASVELIAVGTEMLLGQLVDTNTAFVAARLAENGIDVHATHAIGDNRAADRFRRSTARWSAADGIVMTTGLGPTVDDLTKEVGLRCARVGYRALRAGPGAMEEFFASIGRADATEQSQTGGVSQRQSPAPNPRNRTRLRCLRPATAIRRRACRACPAR